MGDSRRLRGRCWPSVHPRAAFPCPPHAVLWIVAWYKHTFDVVSTRSPVSEACSNSLTLQRKGASSAWQGWRARLNPRHEGRAGIGQALGGRRSDHGAGSWRVGVKIGLSFLSLSLPPMAQSSSSGLRRSCEENHKSAGTTLYQTLLRRTGRYREQGCEAVLREMHGHARGSSSGASHHGRARVAIFPVGWGKGVKRTNMRDQTHDRHILQVLG